MSDLQAFTVAELQKVSYKLAMLCIYGSRREQEEILMERGYKFLVVTTENGMIKPHEEIQQLSFIRADELDAMQLENPLFVVEKILPCGLVIVASPPKYGKSWFVLDMCISAATGTKFLGFKTNKCGVLYLALEDSNNRLQDRMKKVLNGRIAPAKNLQ